jgi:hypothetical protein
MRELIFPKTCIFDCGLLRSPGAFDLQTIPIREGMTRVEAGFSRHRR